MDTLPLTLPSVPEEPEPELPPPWARLMPMVPGFKVLDCIQDSYVVGRDKNSDYVLGDGSTKYRIYSKRHFRIYREGSEAFVEDLSNNGTFIDGLLIGAKRKTPLNNSSVISLCHEKKRDLMSSEQVALPKELEQKYVLTRQIGTGVCGEVKLAYEREHLHKYAVKIINKGNFKSEGTATRNAETEIQILQRIDHPCLMKTVDFYQTEERYYIVLELMEGGELFFRIKSKKQIPEPVAKFYFYQMLLAVQYLHRNGIIHRDLKPENVLLSSSEDFCLIKVTDFNQSRILEEAALMRTLCGTPSYLAPEVFSSASGSGYGLSVDAWSLGVLLFVCLGGYPPFHEQFGPSVRDQIMSGTYTMLPRQWGHISDQAKDLVQRLLVVDPSRRLSIDEALEHPWVQDEEMKQRAHSVMYPEPSTSTSSSGTTGTSGTTGSAGPSASFSSRSSRRAGSSSAVEGKQAPTTRKRNREEDEERPIKRKH
ncbi:serine/threonine-protein kinase Chk2 [Periophthalmus magnuspinnatus]|uniref:serine/threonine-protein kinase Chk2 n=1 Tax=Periophthalmus magnuspinnatus TaxID=409849 RepID=UPI0024363E83|nr:serine/threonine-protein kinase Chk2 [Periophthalmus magnuspinnatus]